ncbi:MAG TPA: protein kinase [Candidatus Binatia bacterium]|nr:protein kinase [Candidatus Binatia bacterium]
MESKCPQCGASLPAGALEGLCPACLLKQGAAAETATQPEVAPFQPPSVEEMARMFPQLEIQAFIGKGGMGAVYKARQPALDRLVALKILPPQVASGPGFAERFNREARALAKLSHPNIVAVHEFGQVNGLPFFIMEFVDGLNLRQLERAGKLSPREALQIVPQICEALEFAHDEGIVHRDIKPENILLDKKGRVKIADFGIAKIMGAEPEIGLTETRGVIGTPQYMAPEQVEKPETVDHRADIFSLGVVFYEMLTGELPLGKFAPPSSKVNVDVRLDDVVLRALEKEPERRYQYASQVKTAVDTIASTTPPPPPPDAQALAREILARDYVLDIGSCLRRSWALVRSEFWPIVGVSALMLLLVQAASSTAVGIVAVGPLMGGLWLYLVNRARGEPAGLDTAFSGFRIAFVNLFLAGFVRFVLTLLGFICLILPGLYLAVAWMFALLLVIDLRLDFWPAMELSRKVVTRHWWKLFGFWLVLLVINAAGALACGIGLFFTAPIALAATVFAYEDIFGSARRKAPELSARVGPSGTAVLATAPAKGSLPGGVAWKPLVAGLAAVVFLLILAVALFAHRAQRIAEAEAWSAQQAAAWEAEARPNFAFGPVTERVFEFSDPNHRALNLASGNFVASTPEHPLDFSLGGSNSLREAGVDLYLSDAALNAFVNKTGRDETEVPRLDVLDRRAFSPALSDDGGGPMNDITSAQNGTLDRLIERREMLEQTDDSLAGSNVFRLVTRDGTESLVQLSGLTDEPRGVRVRYRLLKETSASGEGRNLSLQSLTERRDAAERIGNNAERDRAFARLAGDSARAGKVELVRKSLEGIIDNNMRDQAALDAVRLLAGRRLRKQAIPIAESIIGSELRDRAFSELAR